MSPARKAMRARSRTMARSRTSTPEPVPQDATISSVVEAGIVLGTVESLRRTPDGTAKSSDGAHCR